MKTILEKDKFNLKDLTEVDLIRITGGNVGDMIFTFVASAAAIFEGAPIGGLVGLGYTMYQGVELAKEANNPLGWEGQLKSRGYTR